MGVVLLSCIIKRETTKTRTISCSSLSVLRTRQVRKAQSAVGNGSAAYSSTTAAPHEYLANGILARRPDLPLLPAMSDSIGCSRDSP